MKKIIFLISILTCVVKFSFAQTTFAPAIFTAQDQVTLTVNVANTPMAGQSEAYIWIFSNTTGGVSKDGFTNTAWTNSPSSAKMIAAGTDRWSFTFTGTTMFSQSAGELKDFGFLVKSRDGSRQTSDFKPFRFDPLVFTPTVYRSFPAKVGQDDAITLNFDQSLASALSEQRMTPVSVSVNAFNQAGVQIGSTVRINLKNSSTKIWSAVIIPTRSFTVTAPNKIGSIKYTFNGTILNSLGAPTVVSSAETELTLIDMK
jgi:hypothetical protein